MPADGHFNPLTGIAVQLMGRGHDVRWYAGPTYGARLDRLDMSWFDYERATEVMAGKLNDLFPERSTLKGPKAIASQSAYDILAGQDGPADRDLGSTASSSPGAVYRTVES